jgi:hypothetical protein
MASEQSFTDRVQGTDELGTSVAGMTPPYAPADAAFSLTALNAAVAAAKAANTAVDDARPPYQDAATDRAALVKLIGPLVTQSLAYVKSNTAWAKRYDAVKNLADKVRGISPPKAKTKAKVADPAPDKKERSRGEQSYVEIAAHLKRYIARLEGLGGFAPQDEKISIASFTEHWTTLDGFNQSLPTLAQTLADAISDRQEAYTGPTGLKFVFDGVKTSVKGQYGQASVAYKSISGKKW